MDSGCKVTLVELQWQAKELECAAITEQPATYCGSIDCVTNWMTKTNQTDYEIGRVAGNFTAANDTCKAQAAAAKKGGSALFTSLAVVALAICATTF